MRGVEPRYAVLADAGGGPTVYVSQEYAPGPPDAVPLPAYVASVLGVD